MKFIDESHLRQDYRQIKHNALVLSWAECQTNLVKDGIVVGDIHLQVFNYAGNARPFYTIILHAIVYPAYDSVSCGEVVKISLKIKHGTHNPKVVGSSPAVTNMLCS